MKPLLNHLSKFISVSLELYSPLPLEFTSDLHTLNAYLRTYSDREQKLLEGFVNRLTQKLSAKLQLGTPQPEHNLTVGNLDDALRHYNSCTIKFPELKLELPLQAAEKSFVHERKVHSYRSSGRSKQEEGIKPNRHKFGTRKQLTVDGQMNKENTSILANCKTAQPNYLQGPHDRSLKFIKSEAGLLPYDSNLPRNISMEPRDDKKSKTKPRYDSNDNKPTPIPPQLKIKIKAKPNFELPRLIDNLHQIQRVMKQSDQQLTHLLAQVSFYAEHSFQPQLTHFE